MKKLALFIFFSFHLQSGAFDLNKNCEGYESPISGKLKLNLLIVEDSQWDNDNDIEIIQESFLKAGDVLGLKIILETRFINSTKALHGFPFDHPNYKLMNELGNSETLTMIFSGFEPSSWEKNMSGFKFGLGLQKNGPFIAWAYSKNFSSLVLHEGASFVSKQYFSVKTAAHELGHLLGGLKPTFSSGLMNSYVKSCSLNHKSLQKIQSSSYVF